MGEAERPRLHGEVLELCFEAMHFVLIAELNDDDLHDKRDRRR